MVRKKEPFVSDIKHADQSPSDVTAVYANTLAYLLIESNETEATRIHAGPKLIFHSVTYH